MRTPSPGLRLWTFLLVLSEVLWRYRQPATLSLRAFFVTRLPFATAWLIDTYRVVLLT